MTQHACTDMGWRGGETTSDYAGRASRNVFREMCLEARLPKLDKASPEAREVDKASPEARERQGGNLPLEPSGNAALPTPGSGLPASRAMRQGYPRVRRG